MEPDAYTCLEDDAEVDDSLCEDNAGLLKPESETFCCPAAEL